MTEQFRKSPRANFIDYDGGTFFVTICAKNGAHYFGEISDNKMHLSKIGKFVDNMIKSADRLCTYAEVPLHVVMPNHVHLIVSLRNETPSTGINNSITQRPPAPALRANPDDIRHATVLSKYVNSLKGAVTKHARISGIEFAWHGRYHDHLIRSPKDGNKISEYILKNVTKWQSDCYHTPSNRTDAPRMDAPCTDAPCTDAPCTDVPSARG